MKVRTRLAPSPTGFLHIGTLRTSLFDYALAKRHGGQFIIRIEDTDENRFVEGATEEIYAIHDAFGLNPDESSVHGGQYGPYIQSQRKEIYKEYAQQLLDKGHAYYCFLTKEELESMKEAFKGKGFRSPYRNSTKDEVEKLLSDSKPFTIRLKVPENEIIHYEDGLQGAIKFDTNIVSDEVLIKSSGMASYHLAVVVDDHLMKISHVFRGIEWLPSTPKQILIHKYLGLEMPPYYHLPVILDPEGGKLSKRKGNVSAKQFLQEGYLPAAILNFLMLLGWSSPEERVHGEEEKELFSLDEFIKLFDVKNLNKSNAVFDRQKLLWFNQQYILKATNEEFESIFSSWAEKYLEDESLKELVMNDPKLGDKLKLVKERSKLLSDALNLIRFFYNRPENVNFEIKQLNKIVDKKDELIKEMISMFESFGADSSNWKHEEWENLMRGLGDKFEKKHGDVFMLLRVAIVGEPFSPPLFECLQVLGKEEVLKRLSDA